MGENASSYDRTLAPVRGAALLRLLHLTQKNAFQASCRPETHQSWCVHILFGRLCYRKWLMLFSLKLQRDNWENTLAVDPAKGKTGKKLYFHRTMEMKQPHTITEPYFKTVLNFRLIQQSEVVHLPLFQRSIRCREYGRTSSAEKSTPRKRLMLYFLKFQRNNQ